MTNDYFVYIMTSQTRRTYIGVTNSLERRVWEHKTSSVTGFTSRYHMHALVYFEAFAGVDDAIAREKQLKKWSQAKKYGLIEMLNPDWIDLSIEMFDWVGPDGTVLPVE